MKLRLYTLNLTFLLAVSCGSGGESRRIDGPDSERPGADSPLSSASLRAHSTHAALPAPPSSPRGDYTRIAEEACRYAGGECLSAGECAAGGAMVEGLACRPGIPGLHCCRKPPACEGYGEPSCCEEEDGKTVHAGQAGCDRGLLSCAGRAAAWLSRAGDCSESPAEREQSPAEDAIGSWSGAVSVATAGRWACEQAGGRELPVGAACDGYNVALSAVGICCVPRNLCREEHAGTECCEADGHVRAKECSEGRAFCHPALLGMGTMREVSAGSCAPFSL